MIKILLKIIMAMGIHNAGDLLLRLARIIVQKTKTDKDDKIVEILQQIWDQIQPIIPTQVKVNKLQGFKK